MPVVSLHTTLILQWSSMFLDMTGSMTKTKGYKRWVVIYELGQDGTFHYSRLQRYLRIHCGFVQNLDFYLAWCHFKYPGYLIYYKMWDKIAWKKENKWFELPNGGELFEKKNAVSAKIFFIYKTQGFSFCILMPEIQTCSIS